MAIRARTLSNGQTVYDVITTYQGRDYSERAGTNRAQAESLDRKRKREKQSGQYQPHQLSKGLTLTAYLDVWYARVRARTRQELRRALELHVLPRPWLSEVPMADVKPRHIDRLIDELREQGLSDKRISNILSPLGALFRSAVREEILTTSPLILERNTLQLKRQKTAQLYTGPEIVALTTNEAVPWSSRMLFALMFYTGCRVGEAAGLRWQDLLPAQPLAALHIHQQYDGRPLKTDRARMVPLHPTLEALLAAWHATGYAIATGSEPEPSRHIVENHSRWAKVRHQTKSSARGLMATACKLLGIPPHTHPLHATRSTFISGVRRGGGSKDLLERITHNSAGDIIDRYTQVDWQPLCETVTCFTPDSIQVFPEPNDHKRLDTVNKCAEKPCNHVEKTPLNGGGAGYRTQGKDAANATIAELKASGPSPGQAVIQVEEPEIDWDATLAEFHADDQFRAHQAGEEVAP